jgi:hypothetical protein
MNAIEMKREFLVGYDKVANLDSPGYEDNEISYFLTKAQENVIFDYLNPVGNKFQESFEESEKVRKFFSNLVMPSVDQNGVIKTILSADQNGKIDDNSFIYELADDTWLPISEWIITDSKCGVRKKVLPKTHDEYNANIDNPFTNPDEEFAWRLDVFSPTNRLRHEIVTNGEYNITEYHVRYIKIPSAVVVDEDNPQNNVDCELHEGVHRRIIDEAVKLALETSEERRLGSFVQINNK